MLSGILLREVHPKNKCFSFNLSNNDKYCKKIPVKANVLSNSVFNMLRTNLTPDSPLYVKPHSAGRPKNT